MEASEGQIYSSLEVVPQMTLALEWNGVPMKPCFRSSWWGSHGYASSFPEILNE